MDGRRPTGVARLFGGLRGFGFTCLIAAQAVLTPACAQTTTPPAAAPSTTASPFPWPNGDGAVVKALSERLGGYPQPVAAPAAAPTAASEAVSPPSAPDGSSGSGATSGEATAAQPDGSAGVAPAAPEPRIDIDGRSYPAAPLQQAYANRGFRPLWVDRDGYNERARALMAAFAGADKEGLDPSVYQLGERNAAKPESTSDLVDRELAMTAALLRYTSDVRLGRSQPPQLRRKEAAARTIDPVSILSAAGAASSPAEVTDFVASLPPDDYLYRGLRAALQRYRSLQQDNVWAPVAHKGPLQVGSEDKQVPMIREVLRRLGDLPPAAANGSTRYDEELAAGVRQFQLRHGLAGSGVFNDATRAAFNVSPETRARQVLMNLERRRWMPTDLGDTYVLVQLTDFNLHVIENDRSVLDMRVVIGKPTWPTPSFSDHISYLEFNPYWNVPSGILRKEVLPGMRNNPYYAAARGLKVYSNGRPVDPGSINWSKVDGTRYQFRQDPGNRNALGRMKFMLPNEYAVYLHDTPSRSYFAKPVRAFSHGCVRVEKPMELAEFLLSRNQSKWDRSRIERTIRTGKNSSVSLDTAMPVHLAYFTVWPDSQGRLQFRSDVYGNDSLLERKLFASAG